jgi:hypothetical protein
LCTDPGRPGIVFTDDNELMDGGGGDEEEEEDDGGEKGEERWPVQ